MKKGSKIQFNDDGFVEISGIDPERLFIRRDGVEIRCCDGVEIRCRRGGVEIIDHDGLLSYAIGGGEHGVFESV